MILPKIKFRPMTLEENIDVIKWAYYEDDGSKVMDKLRSIYSTNDLIEKKIDEGYNYINRVFNKEENIKGNK